VVSCERTVRSGGGLVKFAGMIPNRGRVAALHCSYADRHPQISSRAQDTTRGGARESVLLQRSKTRDAYGKYPVRKFQNRYLYTPVILLLALVFLSQENLQPVHPAFGVNFSIIQGFCVVLCIFMLDT